MAASGHKWPQVAAPAERVAASGRSRQFQASGCKWPLSAKSIPPSEQPLCELFLSLLSFSLIFTALLTSSQLSAAHLRSSHLFSPFSHIFSVLFTSPQLISALVSSSRLISAFLSALSDHLSSSLAQNMLPKTDLGAKASDPCSFHREDLTQRSFYTQQAFAQRSLYTQKLFRRDREPFTQRQGSLYSQKTFTQSKLFHTASFHTEKP